MNSSLSIETAQHVQQLPLAPESSRTPAGARRSRFVRLLELLFLSLPSTVVILLFGGTLSTQPALAVLALGLLVWATERALLQNGRIFGGLPGQDGLKRGFLVLWSSLLLFFLPLALLQTPLAVVGLVGVPLGFFLLLVGGVAVLLGGPGSLLFRPRAARAFLQARKQGRSWLDWMLDGLWNRAKKLLWGFGKLWQTGVEAFLGALALLLLPSFLLGLGWSMGWVLSFERVTSYAYFCFFLVAIGIAGIAWCSQHLPLAAARFALEGRMSVFFDFSTTRSLARRCPIAHGSVVLLTALLMLPLFGLRVPRIAPQQVGAFGFTTFALVLLARLFWAKLYHRCQASTATPGRWARLLGRALGLGGGLLLGLFIILGQFIAWRGPYGFFDHFAYLLPVPF